MHAVGLHSALAIKRQRKRRDEQRRAEERRYSSQSGESGLTSPKESIALFDKSIHQHRKINSQQYSTQGMVHSKVITSIGMLHIAVVFLVLGTFLLISGIFPSNITSRKIKEPEIWWNELTIVGIFLIIAGCFFIILNRVIVKREENNLETYVQRQLMRSKSGHTLERDLETGVLNTKHTYNMNQFKYSTDNTIKIMKSTISQIESPVFLTENNNSKIQTKLFLEQISEEQKMIGAMPAVAVRHERRRQENRIKRPSQLYLGGHWTQPPQMSPLTPNSYIQNKHIESLPEVYLCGKISGLHTVVICLLLGAVILVVGLVQLAPGATTSDHKLALLISGSLLLLFGICLAGLRCYLLHCTFISADSPSSSGSHAASENFAQTHITSNL
ncbi:PREDICTED: uncharacterized protein LOC105365943 isoform X2 [Ceratosolen solmsi marchali]|nr:PREDICTED: uncharacterized protein LOC105365943 isoform X2 [Ceratosolen solmsi marchali]